MAPVSFSRKLLVKIISPYLGYDSIAPFLAYPGKAVFVLCYTSNPSAQTIQEFGDKNTPLFEHIITQGQKWGDETQVGFVVGATQPQALARFRALDQTPWILAPGVGAQGGDLASALTAGLNDRGRGVIIPVSRAVLYADDPRGAAQSLRDTINQVRQTLKSKPKVSPPDTDLTDLPDLTDLICQLHDIGCVQFGNFTLASGQQSPIYIDLRRMSCSPALLKRAARAYADLVRPLAFDHVAGVPYAALPIGTALALELGCSLIYPRKEAKAYGMGKSVEGVFKAGERVVVIEDLVTSGGSILKAIEALAGAELVISDAVVLIDREQGGVEALRKKGYRLHAVLKLSEILATLQNIGRISAEEVAAVKQYL